jgi:membrane protease YdiL (CAAX protease family)
VQTPDESGSSAAVNDAHELDAFPLTAAPQQQQIDPDNPPWGVVMAILVWLASLLLLAIASALALIPYAAYRGISATSPDYPRALVEFALKDPWAIFVQVASTVPAHLFTVLIVWAVVTRFGRRRFWETLGWSWGRYFGLWTSIALGAVLFVVSSVIVHLLGGDKLTPLEEIINSSAATRYMIAGLATLTAPFVEELVFRGVLYSALQRFIAKIAAMVSGLELQGLPPTAQLIGKTGAVILVTILFAVVHIPQYQTNYGVIAAICLLSLSLTFIRAFSGRLLPCYVMHLVFNGIQSVIIVWQGGGHPPVTTPNQAGALFWPLLSSLHLLI